MIGIKQIVLPALLLLLFSLEFSTAVSSELQLNLSNFKLDLHRKLEAFRILKKRETEAGLKIQVEDVPPEQFSFLEDFRLTFWTPVDTQYVLVGTLEGDLILFNHQNGSIVARCQDKEVSLRAKVFEYEGNQWFAVLQSLDNTFWISFYIREGRGLERQQTISFKGSTYFDLTTLKGIHYLQVVTDTKRPQLLLYYWRDTHFDVIAKQLRFVSAPRFVTSWTLDGSLYMVVAQEDASPIFLYNSKEDSKMLMLQMLHFDGPRKVLHFYVSGSNYLIFIGRQNAAIYWWSNDQFLLWQIIDNTANALDAKVLTLFSGEIIIVVAMQDRILFLTLDTTGHYVISNSMPFIKTYLESIHFLFAEQAYYALATFANQPFSIWKLSMNPYYLPSVSSMDSLVQCLDDVTEVLDHRQSELNNNFLDLDRVWVKNKKLKVAAQVITTVGGVKSTQPSSIIDVVVLLDIKLPSLSEVDHKKTALKNQLSAAQVSLQETMLKSTPQKIKGSCSFHTQLALPSVSLVAIKSDLPINEFHVLAIKQSALRTSGDQFVAFPALLDGMVSGDVTVEVVNDIQVSDLLLLYGTQEVSGVLSFKEVLSSNVSSERINSIPIENIITKNSHQSINNLKSFTTLTARHTHVTGLTNGKDLSDFVTKIATEEGEDELFGSITFTAPVIVKGDIFLTGTINKGFTIDQLAEKTVTKSENQRLTGQFMFSLPLSVNGDVECSSINGLQLSNLFTLSSPQRIPGSIFFEYFSFVRDIVVDSVNGVDLSGTAVRKNADDQFIEGFTEFKAPFAADFVDMTEHVLLDGVDPSTLVQEIARHVEGVVDHDETAFYNVKVFGNLSVTDGLNGYSFFDWLQTFFLKTLSQEVLANVTAAKISAPSITNVQLVNKLRLDADLIHSYGDEAILPEIFFSDVAQSSKISTNAAVNGFVAQTKPKEENEKYNSNTVRGSKTFQSLLVTGDIYFSSLGDFDANAFMRFNAPQNVHGNLQFEKISINDLSAATVQFSKLNGKDLKIYFNDAVLTGDLKYKLSRKSFLKVIASNLDMDSFNGKVFNRVVTLDGYQSVLSPKTFLDGLAAKSSVIVTSLNGRNLSNLADAVVVTDKTNPVLHPIYFSGSFIVGSVFVRELFNGSNFNNWKNALILKSADNTMEQHLTILGDVDVGKLVIGASVDGVEWSNLIINHNEEALEDMQITSEIILGEDLFITGHLNGCDLTKLGQQALFVNKPEQIIREEIVVESIKVEGNLILLSALNNVDLQQLQRIWVALSSNQVIEITGPISSDMKVTELEAETVNGVDLISLIADAVLHSVPQNIGGVKRYDLVSTGPLSLNELFLQKNLNGVNFNQFYRGIVRKQGDQIIDGEKTFSSLNVGILTVDGFFNGLKLPQDVVLSYTEETIASPVYLKSEVVMGFDFNIMGRINNVSLDHLVQNRVTVYGNNDVKSTIIFNEETLVHGNVIVRGTINNVSLDLVSRIKNNHPVDGRKTFEKELVVSGSIIVETAVNGFDIRNLNLNILRQHLPATLNEMQVFEKSRVADLHLVSISGILLQPIIDTFYKLRSYLGSYLNYFKKLSTDFKGTLSNQLQAVRDQPTRFAHFILSQELYLGPTSKVLKSYGKERIIDGFPLSLALWVSDENCFYTQRCCRRQSTQWLRLDNQGIAYLDGQREQGLFFPIHDPIVRNNELVFWTNASDSQWCYGVWDPKMYLAFHSQDGIKISLPIIDAPLLTDVRSFRQGQLYSIAGFFSDRLDGSYSYAVVYAMDDIKQEWTEHQILPSFGVLSLDTVYFTVNGYTDILLAVGTGFGSYSSIYRWINNEREFSLVQNIPSQFVPSVLWIQSRDVLFFVSASVDEWCLDCVDFVAGGQVDIYLYNTNGLKWLQSLPRPGVIAMISFTWEGETYLVVASRQLQSLYVYKWKGYSGFDPIQSVFIGDIRHMNSFQIGKEFYLAVANESGPLKLLKMITRGQRLDVEDIIQRDEARIDGTPGCTQ